MARCLGFTFGLMLSTLAACAAQPGLARGKEEQGKRANEGRGIRGRRKGMKKRGR